VFRTGQAVNDGNWTSQFFSRRAELPALADLASFCEIEKPRSIANFTRFFDNQKRIT
jgi:hypothetical protein